MKSRSTMKQFAGAVAAAAVVLAWTAAGNTQDPPPGVSFPIEYDTGRVSLPGMAVRVVAGPKSHSNLIDVAVGKIDSLRVFLTASASNTVPTLRVEPAPPAECVHPHDPPQSINQKMTFEGTVGGSLSVSGQLWFWTKDAAGNFYEQTHLLPVIGQSVGPQELPGDGVSLVLCATQ